MLLLLAFNVVFVLFNISHVIVPDHHFCLISFYDHTLLLRLYVFAQERCVLCTLYNNYQRRHFRELFTIHHKYRDYFIHLCTHFCCLAFHRSILKKIIAMHIMLREEFTFEFSLFMAFIAVFLWWKRVWPFHIDTVNKKYELRRRWNWKLCEKYRF